MTTLYLKYRPRRIAELDLVDVRDQLQKILTSGRIPHAFLFAGPRGAGKTSAARILAKAVNCEKPRREEPCNECGQCKAIDAGSSLDIIEIDAASHRGIDDARSLRETIKLSPTTSKKKVYIIDEAHMLTTEASNALLKTLEEPPSHAIFILATTEPQKLLDTVKSRCTTIVFRKAKQHEVVSSLKKAVDGEKLEVEDGVLEEIATCVDGSFREAHKILEQLSYGAEKISMELARQHLTTLLVNPNVLLSCLVKKDVKQGLLEIGRVAEQGVPLRLYTAKILQILRETFLSHYQAGQETGFTISDFGGEEGIKDVIERFSKAAQDTPGAVIPQLPLELAVITWCAKEGKKIESSPRSEVGKEQNRHESPLEENSKKVETPAHLADQWREIMRLARARNTSVEALLRATRPQSFDGKTLIIEVFYNLHKDRIEKEPTRSIIEEVAAQVLSSQVRLICNLSQTKQKAVDLVNISEDVEEDITKIAEEIFAKNNPDEMTN